MPAETFTVFLASSFSELRELRGALRKAIDGHPALPLRTIDLDDGRARHRPPLAQSLDAVRRSDVTVVLVGTQYGGCPPGRSESYTHLEYREASNSGSGTVLVYLVGHAGAEQAARADDPRLASWCREILENHTPVFFAEPDVETVVGSVLVDVQRAIFDMLSEAQRRTLDAFDLEEGDGEGPSRQELMRLAERFDGEAALDLRASARLSSDEALLRPARAAAAEQQREGFRALDLGERAVAIRHFATAADLIPLDPVVNYWRARLLLATGRRQDCREAEAHALRAYRLLKAEGQPFAAAVALLIASRAASRLGNGQDGVTRATQAIELAGWYAGAHLELAARHAEAGELGLAASCVEDAFFCHPPSALRALHGDPSLRRHRRWAGEVRARLAAKVERAARAVLTEEARTAEALGAGAPAVTEPARNSVLAWLGAARDSAGRQLEMLEQAARSARARIDRLREALDSGRSQAEQAAAQAERQRQEHAAARPRVQLHGAVAGFVLGVVAASLQQKVLWIPLLLAAGVALDALVARWRRQRHRAAGELFEERLATTRQQTLHALAGIERELRATADEAESILGERLEALESTAVGWAILSPARGPAAARRGDIVRLHPGRLPDDYLWHVDDRHWPPELADLTASEPPAAAPRLFRVLHRNGNEIAVARWACLLPPAQAA
ncbi:MAG TPA: DUF4062 domain-containing protein [Thermoanaerobaculia bacterium]|nr:DUF4062 domain-containing protein [Thermoanaerobaculia bacterium]